AGISRRASSRRVVGTWRTAPGGDPRRRGATAASAPGCSHPPSKTAKGQQPIPGAGREGRAAPCPAGEAHRRGRALLALGRPELDLARPELLAAAVAAHSPRAIVNAAAYTAVDKAEAEPALAMAVNRDGAGAPVTGAPLLGFGPSGLHR